MKGRRSRRGIALVTTLLMLPIMVLLGFCLSTTAVSNANLTKANEFSKRAEYVAEAGASDGLRRIKADTAYSGTSTYTMNAITGDRASVVVLNNAGGSSNAQAANGATVPPGFAYIWSTCNLLDSRTPTVTRSTGVLVKLSAPSMFNNAVSSETTMTMTGNAKTDSFKSSLGPYNAATNRFFNGHIATNSVGSSTVTMTGNAHVYGNILVGVGGIASSVINAASTMYTSAMAQSTNFSSSSVTLPSGITNMGAAGGGSSSWAPAPGRYSGNVQMSGTAILSLSPGTYVFDSLKLSGQSQLILLNATEKTEIYINGGTLDLSGGSVANPSMKAGNLVVKVVGSGNVKVSGNGTPYFAVYAPDSAISVTGNGDVYGAIVGASVTWNGNGYIHYDEDLAIPNASPPTVRNWQRF